MQFRPLSLIVSTLWIAGFNALASAEKSACPTICSTPQVWGVGSVSTNYAPCVCIDRRANASTTSLNCTCGTCYFQAGHRIAGYSPLPSGECPAGTDCSSCPAEIGHSGSGSTVSVSSSPSPSMSPSPAPETTSTTAPVTKASNHTRTNNVLVFTITALAVALVGVLIIAMWFYRRVQRQKQPSNPLEPVHYVIVQSLEASGNDR